MTKAESHERVRTLIDEARYISKHATWLLLDKPRQWIRWEAIEAVEDIEKEVVRPAGREDVTRVKVLVRGGHYVFGDVPTHTLDWPS